MVLRGLISSRVELAVDSRVPFLLDVMLIIEFYMVMLYGSHFACYWHFDNLSDYFVLT